MSISASEVPAFVAFMYGLDLAAFDAWLSEKPDSESKDALLDYRARLFRHVMAANKEAAEPVASLMRSMFRGDLVTRPFIKRDAARQAGTQKKRGSKQPEIDDFIGASLVECPKATAKELWRMLENFTPDGLYFDGNKVFRAPEGETIGNGLTFGGFEKRVSTARKELKLAANN